jgi:16S rRNA (adenine1518-N6/adenine1519-N6)-dimethyltransferase
LTEPLAGRSRRVIAVEVDRGVAAVLAERLKPLRNVEVRCEDILRFSWEPFHHAVVVGAIPYHITSPILVALCEARRAIDRAVLVMQEEVAQRLAAAPGTKAYGRLSVLVQYGWGVALGARVPPGAFFPAPAVDSRCVELSSRSRPAVQVASEPLFFEVVKAAFSQRRKTLANTLGNLPPATRLPRSEVPGLLASLGLPASVRGEALSLEAFAALANALARRR